MRVSLRRAIFFTLILSFLNSSRVFAIPLTEESLISELPNSKLGLVLKQALFSYGHIQDYRAFFHKREAAANGTLGEPEKIYLKFEKPWKIYLGWLNTAKKGLQVVYERGRHDGKLAIHKPGFFLGLAPVIFLDQKSPWVRQGSASYNIEDAGIGTFLFDFTRAVIKASRENQLQVNFQGKTAERDLNGDKVEVVFKVSENNPDYFAHRIVTVFDEKTRLPVYMELFDWNNRQTGVYAYRDLQVNVGEKDNEFKSQIDRHLLRVYQGN